MKQLSLWDTEEETPAPVAVPPGWHALDEIIVRRKRWADEEYSERSKELLAQGLSLAEVATQLGWSEYTITQWLNSNSATPEQQERLAMAVLGDLDSSFVGNDGMKQFYRCIATGIVDGQVLAAYQYVEPVLKRPVIDDDEEFE